MRLWDVASGKEVGRLTGHKTPVLCVAFSGDGRLLASGGQSVRGLRIQGGQYETDAIRLWALAAGEERFRFGGARGCNCLAFSPDGRSLVTGTMEIPCVHVWETATGRERFRITGQDSMVWTVAFAPDGKTLAVGDMGHDFRLYEWPSGKPAGLVPGHRGWVLSLAYSADGKHLVSGSSDTTALVWDATRLPRDDNGAGQTSPAARQMTFPLPHGEILVTGPEARFNETTASWLRPQDSLRESDLCDAGGS